MSPNVGHTQVSPYPPGTGLNIQQAASALSEPGYLQLENGFTVNDDGSMMLAIRTDQPANFTGEMQVFSTICFCLFKKVQES